MSLRQFLALIPMTVSQRLAKPLLQRVPEPAMVMHDAEGVAGFHAAGETTLDLIYCFAIEAIHIALPEASEVAVLDLACGTGKFTRRLASAFKPGSVRAMDASAEMIRMARADSQASYPCGPIEFETGDITKLGHIADRSFDLTTCSLTAHHLESAEPAVATLLKDMDRITHPDGLVLLLDLARLKSRKLVERYVEVFSPGQTTRHNQDFLDSMLAAFTPDELAAVIPSNTAACRWLHFTSPLLPTLQIVMRVPKSRSPATDPLWKESPTPLVGNLEWRWLSSQFRKRCLRAWQTAGA